MKFLCLIAAAALSIKATPAFAYEPNARCFFNSREETCELAGSSYSFTASYSDGVKITMEKVGVDHECGDGSRDSCGKYLITELKNGRTTWASFRRTQRNAGVTLSVRSARGNNYLFSIFGLF